MTTRKAKQSPPLLPELPAQVWTVLGPLPVLVVDDLRAPDDATEPLFGYWNPFARTISIRAGMHPVAAWLTLWHERTHAELSEIGVKLSEDQEEAVANAIASARVAEMLALPCTAGDAIGPQVVSMPAKKRPAKKPPRAKKPPKKRAAPDRPVSDPNVAAFDVVHRLTQDGPPVPAKDGR